MVQRFQVIVSYLSKVANFSLPPTSEVMTLRRYRNECIIIIIWRLHWGDSA